MKAVWEDVARRQCSQRQHAETENAQLSVLLEEQLQVIKSLSRLLSKKRTNIELLAVSSEKAKRMRSFKSKSPMGLPYRIEELLRTVDMMYTQVDEVLRDARFHPSTLATIALQPFREVRLRDDLTWGTFVEVVEARVLPIDLHTVADLFWKNIDPSPKRHLYEETTQSNEHTFAKTFEHAMRDKDASGDVRGQAVIRRFLEANRVVITICVLGEPEQLFGTKLDGILIRHQIWHVIQRLPDNQTYFQSYHAGLPEIYEGRPNDNQKVGVVTNFLLATIDFHLGYGEQVLENVLLTHAKSSESQRRK